MEKQQDKIKRATQFALRTVDQVTAAHWRLLLLADPSRELVQRYLRTGRTFALVGDAGPVAVMVLQEISSAKLEVKNIAVDPKFENRGLATRLLRYAIRFAGEGHYRQLLIGTGSTSFKQLYLYQKMGFRITRVKRDFFVENYQQPIHENGLLLRDMLVLTLNL